MKILVLVDVQNDFITGSLANKEAQKAIPNIIKKIEEFDGDMIFCTQDTHDEWYLETAEGKKLPVEHCIRGTEGWEINSDVLAALREKGTTFELVEKPTFGSEYLAYKVYQLAGLEMFDVEFCGFCTDICVVSNALNIKMKLFQSANITVDASCCAGVTPEKHNAALDVMESCQINVINRY